MQINGLNPQVVDTLTELDALPLGAVVVDITGVPWERTDEGWEGYPAQHLVNRGPLALVHVPHAA
jgi:hypothetical protein